MLNFVKRILFDFIANFIAPIFWVPGVLRKYLYKSVGIEVHTTSVKRHVYINSNQVSVGKGSLINSFTKLFSAYYEGGNIEIGKNVYIGMNALLCTISHKVGNSDCRAGQGLYRPIKIEDGCWIGANVTVLPGVTIGKGCIIAAGAVVTRDCAPNGMYAGVPAKRIKELD